MTLVSGHGVRGETMGAIRTVSARKKRPAAEHLRHDASYTPDVDRACVFLESEHNLRGTVPPDDNAVSCASCAGEGYLLTGSRRILS